MKINLKIISLILMLALVAGCATTGFFGKSSNQVAKQADKIEAVQTKIDTVKENKVAEVQTFSYGVGYSLKQATNQEPAVVVAQELNQRVESIVGLPPLAQQKAMMEMVSQLISNNVVGEKMLAQKDAEIAAIQAEETFLLHAKELETQKALDLSAKVALHNDATQQALDKYQGWFGLSAVFMGMKQFITTSFWALVIFGVLFLILRLLSTVNPIAGAIFAIVDTIFAWIVNTIKIIAPKALAMANTVEKKVFEATSNTLNKVVDSIETTKLRADGTGKEPTVNDLLTEASKSMSPEDKALIQTLKVKMGWK